MSSHITGIRIQKWKGHPAFEKLPVCWGRQIQKKLQKCDWNELRTRKTWEKTINFSKITREDFTEEVTFEKVWKDMEKGDLGWARRKWMSSGWGVTQYPKRAESFINTCSGTCSGIHSLSSLRSAQPEKLKCSSSSFLSYIKAQFHLPISINLMGYKCWVF